MRICVLAYLLSFLMRNKFSDIIKFSPTEIERHDFRALNDHNSFYISEI